MSGASRAASLITMVHCKFSRRLLRSILPLAILSTLLTHSVLIFYCKEKLENNDRVDLKRDDDGGGVRHCGKDKCFFRSFNGSSFVNDPNIGYLISINTREWQSEFDDGWKLAQYLESKFGIQHFLLEAPQKVNLTLPPLINLRTTSKLVLPGTMYQNGHLATVQKVKVAPSPSHVFRPDHSFSEELDRLLHSSMNKTRFVENLGHQLKPTLETLISEPLLSLDFQIMIDAEGNIYHLDFDRVFISGIYKRSSKFKVFLRESQNNAAKMMRALYLWTKSQQQLQTSPTPPQDDNFASKVVSMNWTTISNNDAYQKDGWTVTEMNLSCIAVEHVGAMRHSFKTRPLNALTRALMVNLVQRMVLGGYYGNEKGAWDCGIRKGRHALLPFSEAPIPVIFLSHGSCGSSSTWQILGNLTGRETSPYFDSPQCKRMGSLEGVKENDAGMLTMSCLRRKQEQYLSKKEDHNMDPLSFGFAGFKWKPATSLFKKRAMPAWDFIAKSKVHLIRSKRNLLDMVKNRALNDYLNHHCSKEDKECVKQHLQTGSGIMLPTKRLLSQLRSLARREEELDQFLVSKDVKHIQVTYEKLFYANAIDEWMRIFRFLELGPGVGLTREQLDGAMNHVATHVLSHNVTLANYAEVRHTLVGTEFETLLL